MVLLQKNIVEQHGIMFSRVGYKSVKRDFASNDINVELAASTMELNEVVIASPKESIVERAIRKIPENYRFEPFTLIGKLQIINSATNRAGWSTDSSAKSHCFFNMESYSILG